MNYFKLFATLVKAMVKSLRTRQYVLTFEKESDNLWYTSVRDNELYLNAL